MMMYLCSTQSNSSSHVINQNHNRFEPPGYKIMFRVRGYSSFCYLFGGSGDVGTTAATNIT